MMKTRFLILSFLTCAIAVPAMADLTNFQKLLNAPSVDLNGDLVIDNLDGILVAGPSYPTSSVNVLTDAEAYDALWSISGAGGSWATVVIELAGFANSNLLGIYDAANSGNTVQLFSGAAAAGSQTVVSIKEDGSVWVNLADTGKDFSGNAFGFYLDSSSQQGGGFFYSDTLLNGDGVDHMLAYRGKDKDTVKLPGLAAGLWSSNEYIIGFEDLLNGGDMDYDDFVFMVESVHPVPVPAAVLLGFLGLGAAGLKLRRFA